MQVFILQSIIFAPGAGTLKEIFKISDSYDASVESLGRIRRTSAHFTAFQTNALVMSFRNVYFLFLLSANLSQLFTFSNIFLEKPVVEQNANPCVPNPCGPNSDCRSANDLPVCTCLKDYVGRPPNCRPECLISSECASNLSCQKEKCRDPCPGSCGPFALCRVINHSPICSCLPNHTGDPFAGCAPVQSKLFSSALLSKSRG